MSVKAEAPGGSAVSTAALAKSALHRPVVAVDLDEVLGATVEALSRYHNERHGTGECSLTVWLLLFKLCRECA
jgi:hypothetical protein